MARLARWTVVVLIIAAAIGLWLTAPITGDTDRFAGLTGDAENGALVFAAAGCRGCHAAPEDEGSDPPVLAGGYRIDSPFGTFLSPNISTGPGGLDGWSFTEFAVAITAGVSPDGRHYFPAFPYTTYAQMTENDLSDLWAYVQTLPASDVESQPHELSFPFNIRRGVGLWKRTAPIGWVISEPNSDEIARGRYLVEALGHCAECHTPRRLSGHLDRRRWMRGAPNPSGKGRIPSIHPEDLTWSVGDIAYYLESGFTPDFDSAGGQMTEVVRNLAKLAPEDRQAIAAYLKALP
jgi:mono/diheme cytochrome c family protein